MGFGQGSELADQPKWKNLTGWLRSIYEVLCARENSHAETGKALPQTVPKKLEAQNYLECLGKLKHYSFPSLKLETKEPGQLQKNNLNGIILIK